MLKRIKYNVIHELSPQGSQAWLNQVCRKCVVKMDINNHEISSGKIWGCIIVFGLVPLRFNLMSSSIDSFSKYHMFEC